MKTVPCVYCDGDGWIRVQSAIRTVSITCPICGGGKRLIEGFDQQASIDKWEKEMSAHQEPA